MAWGCGPRQVLAQLTSEELTELMGFAQLEPFGSAADDERAGTIAAAVHNNRGMVNPPTEAKEAGDYFPRIKAPAKRKTQRELREAAKRVAKKRGRG